MKKKIAFLFPGQGSQFVGMLHDFKDESVVIDTFEEASSILNEDLWKICQDNTNNKLNRTEYTQPILLTASVALWRLWASQINIQPECMAGHSLGEFSALVCSGVLEFSDTVALVKKRGIFMQDAIEGHSAAMAAIIGLDDNDVIELCLKHTDTNIVEAVNFNSPGQVVIAGHIVAVERVMLDAKAIGAKRAILLPVSVPSHCCLMKSASDKLAEALSLVNFKKTNIPIIQNLDAQISSNPIVIRKKLIKQLYQPVLWSKSIQLISERKIDFFIEFGPGKILSSLNKRIIKSSMSYSIGDYKMMQYCLTFFNKDNKNCSI